MTPETYAVGMAVDPNTQSYEFVAEIVRKPSGDERTVTFRYVNVLEGAPEISVSTDWWESLGRPDFISVTVRPDFEFDAS
jgi:hypothetical protein